MVQLGKDKRRSAFCTADRPGDARVFPESADRTGFDLRDYSPTQKMTSKLNLPPKLVEYLNEARAPRPSLSDPDEPLHIDSLGMIRLISFFENDLGIRIEDEEILADNFSTPRQIARLLAEKAAKSNSEFAIPGAKGHQA